MAERKGHRPEMTPEVKLVVVKFDFKTGDNDEQ